LTATRAYQATLPDFIRWLEEEQQEKRNRERQDAAKKAADFSNSRSRSISPSRKISTSAKPKRRSSWNQSQSSRDKMNEMMSHSPRKGRRPGLEEEVMEEEENFQFENSDYRYELLKHQHQQRMETESMIGGPSIYILQSLLNPSDPFIADDYLSPYNESTYDHPARKTLPDPIQHAAEKKAIADERKRRRKARGPRMAFRRMMTGKHSPGGTHDFDLVDSMIVDANNDSYFSPGKSPSSAGNDEENPLMTTPLHEAARLGSGDFVRLLLANGGDPNVKNGSLQTTYHICAGGYTAEEKKLVEAAMAAAEIEESLATGSEHGAPHMKKKKIFRRSSKSKAVPPSSSFDSSASTAEFTGGIAPIVIPKESLELLREMDSDELDTTKEKKKASSSSKSKRSLFGKMISFRSKKDRKGRKNNTENAEGDNPLSTLRKKSMRVDVDRLNDLMTNRMDAMTALLSFVHRESGEGPSINAVDHNGRTSLHYAAELGRSEICTAMLAHFGIMLTIVDEMGTRTPCEIAADRSHTALAALLEARALLYIDPYGLDDEMLDMIMAANEGSGGRKNPHGRLVPPFRWFITLSKEDIASERDELLDRAREKLMQALLETSCPNEDEDNVECATPYVPVPNMYAITTLANDQEQSELPPVSDNQEIIDGDQKAPASNSSEIVGSEIGEKELPSLTDSQVEQYMTYHKWNFQSALDAFQENREEAFAAAGIQYVFDEKRRAKTFEIEANTFTCPICYDDEIENEDWISLGNCKHGFCRDCLQDYLKESAKNRTPSHLVTCPDHNCNAGISKQNLQSLLEKDDPKTFDSIMDASNDNFITSHTNFRFCPHPGCSGIIHRFPQPKWASADYDENVLNYTGAVCTAVTPRTEQVGNECTLTYEGVEDLEYTNCRSLQQPKKAHRFCFSCGEGVHWPLTCERLAEWKERINDEIGKVDENNGGSDFNELAQKVWLKANTRPCPQCKAPIEKADGCNHMVCHNCHHEFCWICRQDWNLHSTGTGGFFRCNIWREDDEERVLDKEDGYDEDEQGGNGHSNENYFEGMVNDQGYGSSMHTSRKAWKRKQEIRRFLDHYSHWEAHKESNTLEQKMADNVCTRLSQVVEAAIDFDGSPAFNFGGKGLSFIHNAFFELAECRSTLRYSYAFSFYRYPSKAFSKASLSPPKSYLGNKRKEKFRFERLQAELETLTEQMSDIVARSHLRASQIQITYLTSGAAEKRLELNNFLFQIYREEKREAMRQKQREEEEKRRPPLSARHYIAAMNHMQGRRGAEFSSSQEMFNRLMQLRDQRYEETTTPYVTVGDLPSNGRDLSMQLMAQDQRLHAIGERLRGMEGMLRTHQNRNSYLNEENRYDDEEIAVPASQMWDCSRCTFMNTGGNFCAMCETPRGF